MPDPKQQQFRVKRDFTDHNGTEHKVGQTITGNAADLQQYVDAGDIEMVSSQSR